jgi:hypothetical protein
LSTLLDEYGAAELEQAITEALQQQVPHPNAVRQVLERRREQQHRPPPIALALPDNAKAHHIVVRPAPLALYDQLDGSVRTDDNDAQPDAITAGDADTDKEHSHD